LRVVDVMKEARRCVREHAHRQPSVGVAQDASALVSELGATAYRHHRGRHDGDERAARLL
jgi:hypothetical protein